MNDRCLPRQEQNSAYKRTWRAPASAYHQEKEGTSTCMPTKMLTVFWVLLALSLTGVQATSGQEKRNEFTVPAAPWILTLPNRDIVIERKDFKPDGKSGYFSMINKKNNVIISFYIEPVKDCKDSKACRDMVWKLGNPAWENLQNIVQSEIGDVSCLEFLMPSFQ